MRSSCVNINGYLKGSTDDRRAYTMRYYCNKLVVIAWVLLMYKAMLRRGLTDLQCSRFSIELPPNQRIPDERMSIASGGHGRRGAFHKIFNAISQQTALSYSDAATWRPGVG